MGALDAVRAERRANWDALENGPAGGFMFDVDHRSVIYLCPCGCEQLGALPIVKGDEQAAQRPAWHWNGNEDSPTLTPSIRRLDGCRWHGFLTAGEWQPCGDSGRG